MREKEIFKVKKMIVIDGNISRDKIVKKVVNTFISTEYKRKEKGKIFQYPVENFSDGTKLYISRPGHKKNFDFKVEVEERFCLGKGAHIEIAIDLRKKRQENPEKFKEMFKVIEQIYHCSENNVDKILKEYPDLDKKFRTGAKVEVLLKIIKWLFIMEDIVYWDNEGRAFLFNSFKYVSEEKDNNRLEEALEKIKNPDRLKSYMRKSNMNWQKPSK